MTEAEPRYAPAGNKKGGASERSTRTESTGELIAYDTGTVRTHAATEVQHVRLLASDDIAILTKHLFRFHEHFSIYIHTVEI